MALTYEQTAELMKDVVFRGRVGVACVNYARYIIDEAATTPARYRWAQQTLIMPETAISQVIPTVVTDSAVQDAGGATITDPALQSAVETAVNKLL